MRLWGAALVMGFVGFGAVALAAGCGGGGSASGGGDGGSGGDLSGSGSSTQSGGTQSGGTQSGGTQSGSGSTTAQGSGGGGTGDCSTEEPTHTGKATYYNEADGTGNCSFDASPNDLMIGAMNTPDYAGSAACGACVKLAGPNAEITIRIVDRCPGCPQGNIDLSPEAFSKIADLSAGVVPITWTYTECPVNGPIVYHWKEGSNQWWTAVQIRNHRHAIKTVEYKLADGTYKSIPRVDYNYFIDDSGMGPGPYDMRVTDVYDQVVEDTGVPFVEAGDSTGASQLPACVVK